MGTSLFTLNARCDSKDREDLVRVLGERRHDVVVIVGAPERVREQLDEPGVLDGHPHRAFFPMDHLPSCGRAVYARVPVEEVADSPVPAVGLEMEGGAVVLVPADVPGPQGGVAAWEQEIAAFGEAAARQVAAGWPVIEIDHVLVSGGVEVGSIETVRVGRQAHLTLLAWVRVGMRRSDGTPGGGGTPGRRRRRG